MRLRMIAHEIDAALPHLQFGVTHMDGGNVKIINHPSVINAVEHIRQAGALTPYVAAVFNIEEVVLSQGPQIVVSKPVYERFSSALNDLKQRAVLLRDAIISSLPKEHPEYIALLLPSGHDLKNLAADLVEIERILSQAIVNQYAEGEVRLVGFDNGSQWLELSLNSIKAVCIVGGMLAVLQQVQLNQVQVTAALEGVRTIALRNDALAAEVNAFEALLENDTDRVLTEQTNRLATYSRVPDDDYDYRGRLKNATKELGDMILRGLEVHPALVAPPEVRTAFPVPEQLTAALRALAAPKARIESQPPAE